MLQVRELPDEIHRVLEVRTVLTGSSLSEAVLRERDTDFEVFASSG